MLISINALHQTIREFPSQSVKIHAQIEQITRKDATNGKPFYEIIFRDSTASMTLRAWNDTPAFNTSLSLSANDFVSIEGIFSYNSAFGFDAKRWTISPLSDESDIETLLEGSSNRRELLDASWGTITSAVHSISDPMLKLLCEKFMTDHGLRFRRAVAAKHNHHARRGGLLEHTARMMQSALAICAIYTELNRDLVIAGILFHDAGKLWETCSSERSFGIVPEIHGELLGHLVVGIEIINSLWRDLPKVGEDDYRSETRLHLLHLVASHHGKMEFGSPVLPKTPEASILHFIDNIDARMEMFSSAYQTTLASPQGIYPWIKSLGVSPIRPLPKYQQAKVEELFPTQIEPLLL